MGIDSRVRAIPKLQTPVLCFQNSARAHVIKVINFNPSMDK